MLFRSAAAYHRFKTSDNLFNYRAYLEEGLDACEEQMCIRDRTGKVLLDACINGSSELMTNLSMSLVHILYNYQLLRLAGENGVAAYGVIMYALSLRHI